MALFYSCNPCQMKKNIISNKLRIPEFGGKSLIKKCVADRKSMQLNDNNQ